MLDSTTRKTLALAAGIALPPILILRYWAGLPYAGWLALAAATPATLAALFTARYVVFQIRQATAFVSQMLESGATRAQLNTGDGELGLLLRALNETAPRVDELGSRLNVEIARREAILATMTEGVLAVDARLNIAFCNAFVRAAGDHSATEGVPLLRVVREPDLIGVLKEVVESGEPIRRRLHLAAQDGHTFDVYAAPLVGSKSRGAIAILHDVTPSVHLDRVRRDFIANVSHEFRTPLATIRGFAETLLDGGLEDQENRRKFVEIIMANSVRLNNIAADLLTLSEIEGGRPEADAGLISVRDVISSAIRAVEPAANVADVRIQSDDYPDAYVKGHRIRFEQAILNLLDNAVKFNKPQGEVRVQVFRSRDGQIDISVSDTGMGIPREDVTRIFERFYRVDKARSRQIGGTGLGLSIVKHAIEQMGGAVRVESELGRGSKFLVTLPLHPN